MKLSFRSLKYMKMPLSVSKFILNGENKRFFRLHESYIIFNIIDNILKTFYKSQN